jgi:hypothetical protein
MWTVYQDSPAYGCDDNPSYKWYAYRSSGGHIRDQAGPFSTEAEALAHVKAAG